MELNYPDSLKGHFLIAMPELADPNFIQTVIFICEHTQAGAVGLVVNRLHSFLAGKDLYDELKMEYVPAAESVAVFAGGPVHVNEIFILHGPPFDWQGCLAVTPTLAMSNTIDILQSVAMGRGPDDFIITLGCAGWGPGQLESEIKGNVWLTVSASKEILFAIPVESRWEAAMRKVGIDPALLSGKAGHA
jgi:putative transcriptional regulator